MLVWLFRMAATSATCWARRSAASASASAASAAASASASASSASASAWSATASAASSSASAASSSTSAASAPCAVSALVRAAFALVRAVSTLVRAASAFPCAAFTFAFASAASSGRSPVSVVNSWRNPSRRARILEAFTRPLALAGLFAPPSPSSPAGPAKPVTSSPIAGGVVPASSSTCFVEPSGCMMVMTPSDIATTAPVNAGCAGFTGFTRTRMATQPSSSLRACITTRAPSLKVPLTRGPPGFLILMSGLARDMVISPLLPFWLIVTESASTSLRKGSPSTTPTKALRFGPFAAVPPSSRITTGS